MEDVLLYFSLLHGGDWEKIFSSIKNLEGIDRDKFAELNLQNNSNYITLISPLYPESLKKLPSPPFVIFYRGNINLLKSENIIAVIGSRKRSSYGQKMAFQIAKDLVSNDYVVISGLASGIDKDAHEGALAGNSDKTIAVLPCGFDAIYPPENQPLMNAIADLGLVITEYPSYIKADKRNFSHRNRLIAGLAKGIAVIEAQERSGTSITVGYALDYGKDIFALPARVDEIAGTNRLLKNGAILIESAQDIIDYLSSITQ